MGSLDDIDILILNKLQGQGRTKRNELAELTGLSLPSVSDRLRKLENAGYIRGYVTVLDHKKFGLDITAFISVMIESSKHYGHFIDKAIKTEEILECHSITGQGTHILKIRTKDTTSLERLLSKIQSWQGVTGTMTSIVLSSPKESMEIPIAKSK
jgi:Lrp/AsnC family transcriptional regulator, leucine-responsive regulatory protein